MGMPAARVTDMHVCPMVTGIVPHVGGPILPPCAMTVLTGMMPQARVTDLCVCVGPPDVIVKGAFTVLVMGLPAARLGDMTAHGGTIVFGLPTVLIGDANSASAGSTTTAMGPAGPSAAMGNFSFQAPAPTSIASDRQAETLKQAAQDGTPFCEQCQA